MTIDGVILGAMTIVFFATLVRATFGFGEALVAMPLLTVTLGLPLRVAAPFLAILSLCSSVLILFGNWKHVNFSGAWRLVVASWVGIPIGIVLVDYAPEYAIKLLLAVIVIGFSTYRLLNPHRWHLDSDRSGFGFGFAAGILGGMYNTQGPPVVIFGTLRRWTAQQFRATFQSFAFPTGAMIVVGHGLSGRLNADVGNLVLFALPSVIASVMIGRRVSIYLRDQRFVQLVYFLLILIGVSLIANVVQTWGNDSQSTDSVAVTSQTAPRTEEEVSQGGR